jgi:O-antigen/teichoic acid export membrane protein
LISILFNKGIFLNSISSVIEGLATPVLMLVMTPIFLDTLGAEDFAIWVLVNTFVASLMALSFGGGNTIIKYLSDAKYQDKNIFSSIFLFQLFVIVIISVFFYILSYLAEKIITYDLFEFANYVVALFFIKQLEFLNYAFCKGKERFEVSSVLSSVAKLSFFGVQLIALIFDNGLGLIFEYAIYASIVVYTAQIVILKKIFLDFFLLKFFDIRKIKAIFDYSVWSWYISIVGIFYSNFDKWLVGLILGLEGLGYYAVAILFYNQAYMLVSSLVAWFFPMVSREGSTYNTHYLYNTLTKLISFSSVVVCALLLNYEQIFIIWLGEANYSNSSDYITLFLFLLPIFVLKIIPHYMLLAKGMLREKLKYDVMIVLIRIIGGIFLMIQFGVNGLVSWFAVDLLFTIALYNGNFLNILNLDTKLFIAFSVCFSLFGLIISL